MRRDPLRRREGRDVTAFELEPVGRVSSPLTDPREAPKQADEGAPAAWLELDPGVGAAIEGLRPGDRVIVLTWLDRADRGMLRVHPRDDPSNPLTGVFATRSADRPNPIGLHEAEITEVDGERIRVKALEAVDGTPILDIKPVIGPAAAR
ncbi:MAG: tRNA (N6-threonylcarbamoyladenosine(37)-N6)-methyltransferase TrmO [Solirubrobacterales bacterium]